MIRRFLPRPGIGGLLIALSFACATAQPKPEETPVNAAPSVDGGAPAEAPDAALPPVTDVEPDAGPEAEKAQESSASAARTEEEKEQKAKEDERKAEADRLKVVQNKITSDFGTAFQSIKSGKDDDAIAEYNKVLQEHPEAFAAHYNLGVMYERKNEPEKAIEEYERALDINPDFDSASDNLSRLYIRAGDKEKAERTLRQHILAHPKNLAFRNQLVRVMMAEGRMDQAEIDSKQILKRDERNIDAMLNLALIWYSEKKYELAKQVLESARDIVVKQGTDDPTGSSVDPRGPAVWNLLAFTQLNLDQRTLAIESFKHAAAMRPDYPEAHNNYGAMLNEVNDCDNAIHELELAVRFAPEYTEAHLNLGNAYRCAHRYKDALAEYDKAQGLNTKSLDPVFNTAITYLDGFDMDVDYDKTNPLDSSKLERLKKAVVYFERFKESGGQDDRFTRYYEEAQKGVTAEEKHLQREKDRGEKAVEREKRDAERKKQEAEKAKEEAKRRLDWREKYQVAGKSDVEDDQKLEAPVVVPAPAPVQPAQPVVVPVSGAAASPEATVAPAPVPAAPPPQMKKLAPKEDLP